jgi:hypothetical protein
MGLETELAGVQLGDSPTYFLIPVFGGAYLVNNLPATLPEEPRLRDALLALTPYANGVWGSVLKSAISKTVAQGYTLNGEDDSLLQARALLDRGGLTQFMIAHLKDYYCTNAGAWLRVGANGAYTHLDALRVDAVSASVLIYYTDAGEFEELDNSDAVNTVDAAGCVAMQCYSGIRVASQTPSEIVFAEGVTVQAMRETGTFNYQGHLIIPVLPETPLASDKVPTHHIALGRVNYGLTGWKQAFSSAVSTHVLQGHVSFSFPTGDTKKNKIGGEQVAPAEQQPIYVTINMPTQPPAQNIINMPAQELPAPQITVTAQAPEPQILVQFTAPEQPAPIVNIAPTQVTVEAAQVNVPAPVINNEITLPERTAQSKMVVHRDQAGRITTAEIETQTE